MMRNLIFLVFSVALIGGCQSDEEVAALEPDEVIKSIKAPGQIANCFAQTPMSEVSTKMRSDGAIVIKQLADKGNAGATFTIIPEGTGSKIEIRQSTFANLSRHRSCY